MQTNLGRRLVVGVHALQPLQDPASVEASVFILVSAAAHLSELRAGIGHTSIGLVVVSYGIGAVER